MSLIKRICALRNLVLLLAALAVVFSTVYVRPARAQDAIDRKVKNRVSPMYPEIARKMNLGGTVKLEIVVAANGAVKETKVIGGHPILIPAAVDAVKKWKFEPGSSDTTGTVEFKFEPEN